MRFKLKIPLASLLCLFAGLTAMSAQEQVEFPGWATLEVIKLDHAQMHRGQASTSARIRVGDVSNDGKQNVLIVQRRQGTIAWLRYVSAKQRNGPKPSLDANEIPLSPSFDEQRVRFERLPWDVQVIRPGFVAVLVGPPNYLEIYQVDPEKQGQAAWELKHKVALLEGSPLMHLPMLWAADQNQLLIATDAGVQIANLDQEHKPSISWMRPRLENVPRKWFLSDLDGDGDKDLMKVFHSGVETIVWHRNEDGFRPPQSLFEQKVRDVAILEDPASQMSDIYLIDAIGEALLRRYRLQFDEEQRFGQRRALSLPSQQAAWCGTKISGDRALVVCDTEHPQFIVYPFTKGDWRMAMNFPCVDEVQAVYAVPSAPHKLLIKRKDAAELYQSEWKNGRFTYPQPWLPQEHSAKKAKILNMGQVGNGEKSILWWTQSQDSDLVLFTWSHTQQNPHAVRFPKQGLKVESAKWLGDEQLLIKYQFKRDGNLLSKNGDEITKVASAHLKNISMDAYRVALNDQQKIVPLRLDKGVMQWLDKDLHATDQVMLDDGMSIDDYIILGRDAFALHAEGRHLVLLQRDKSGVLRRAERFDIPGGVSVKVDPILGVFIQEPGWICRLDKGQSLTLRVVEHIDEESVRPAEVKEQVFHRLFAVTLDGQQEPGLIVTDDVRHRLSLFSAKGDVTTPLASWQVYEDGSYPYGAAEPRNYRQEPRFVRSLQFDDDDRPDLMLLCHDRLLFYLSEEK